VIVEWIKVEDKMPGLHVEVLLCYPPDEFVIGSLIVRSTGDYVWDCDGIDMEFDHYSHWAALVAPTQEADDE
jgi:uncharacterized protein DUF551